MTPYTVQEAMAMFSEYLQSISNELCPRFTCTVKFLARVN